MIALYILLAGFNGMAMMLMGAYGAHGLVEAEPALRALFQSAWQIHSVHSLFIAMVGLYGRHNHWLHGAFWLGLAGMALFCLPIYGQALGWWPAGSVLTPVGGFLLIVAWFSLVLAAISRIRTRAFRGGDPETIRRRYEAMAPLRNRER